MGKPSKQTKVHASARKTVTNDEMTEAKPPEILQKEIVAEHLPPIGLIFTVITCSGFLFMFSFRDVFATGRNVGGSMDEAMLVCRLSKSREE
jgi:hypothetical protein